MKKKENLIKKEDRINRQKDDKETIEEANKQI